MCEGCLSLTTAVSQPVLETRLFFAHVVQSDVRRTEASIK
jgi:hypothetical protein